jgi:hypothetical protein
MKPWMLASVVYVSVSVSFGVSDSEMDNFLVAGSNHGGMEGQISGLVAEAPLTSHDPARSVACRQNAGDRTLYAQHKKRRERHVTALPFRVSLRHAAVQLSSRFASLGSEEKVNAAWIRCNWLFFAVQHFTFVSHSSWFLH